MSVWRGAPKRGCEVGDRLVGGALSRVSLELAVLRSWAVHLEGADVKVVCDVT